MNPSKRKQIWLFEFQSSLGIFYKFIRASSLEKAKEIANKWTPKSDEGYITIQVKSYSTIKSLKDILKIKGMLLE